MKKIASDVWKLNVDSNLYLLGLREKIVIDSGPRAYHNDVKQKIEKITDLKDIKKVILTHIHYDHVGNIDLFPNAEIFASKKEIEDFKKDPLVAFNLNPKILLALKNSLRDIESISQFLKENNIEIINVPGHTKGSIALFYKKEKILFSGDCLFKNGIGRYDLPNSAPREMEKSLSKLKGINYSILAPGHDY